MQERTTLKDILKLYEERRLVGAFRLTNADYHAAPGLSRSALLNLMVSPKYFKWKLQNPDEWTDALIFGAAYHLVIMQDEKFEDNFYLNKTQPRDPKPDAQGRMPLGEKNLEKIMGMRKAFFEDEQARRSLNGMREVSFFWTDPETGVLLKCKVDVLLKTGVIVDYKTAADIDDAKIPFSIKDHGYDLQGAMTIDGVNLALEQSGQDIGLTGPAHKFVLSFQEKCEPFDMNMKPLGPHSIVVGEKKYKEALDLYIKCVREDRWPGKSGFGVVEFEMPQYHINTELGGTGLI